MTIRAVVRRRREETVKVRRVRATLRIQFPSSAALKRVKGSPGSERFLFTLSRVSTEDGWDGSQLFLFKRGRSMAEASNTSRSAKGVNTVIFRNGTPNASGGDMYGQKRPAMETKLRKRESEHVKKKRLRRVDFPGLNSHI